MAKRPRLGVIPWTLCEVSTKVATKVSTLTMHTFCTCVRIATLTLIYLARARARGFCQSVLGGRFWFGSRRALEVLGQPFGTQLNRTAPIYLDLRANAVQLA